MHKARNMATTRSDQVGITERIRNNRTIPSRALLSFIAGDSFDNNDRVFGGLPAQMCDKFYWKEKLSVPTVFTRILFQKLWRKWQFFSSG